MARRPSPADSVRVRQERGIGIGRRPRVLMLGTPRDAYGPLGRLADALCSEVIVREAPPPARLLPAMLAVRRAARSGEAEVVHLWDERHACALLALPRGVPVTMTVGERRTGRSPLAWLALRARRRADELFVPTDAASPGLPGDAWVTPVPTVAEPLPAPGERVLRRVAATVRTVLPGRLIIAAPWPADVTSLRWFRDVVIPHAAGAPHVILFGAPGRRATSLALGPHHRGRISVIRGAVTAPLIAAVARCADAFVIPPPLGAPEGLALKLAASGVPVVARCASPAPVLAHERNAFTVTSDDDHSFLSTLDRVLRLPAVQRHMLGEEFARYTLAAHPAEAAAAVYGERFCALVGRPRVPGMLRAA